MKGLFHLSLVLAGSLCLTGCGGGEEAELPNAPATTAPQAPASVEAAVHSSPASPSAPPSGSAPAAIQTAPDPIESIKISRDGSPNKTDLEALQAVVDAYSFGPSGEGGMPPLNSLDDLVTKGYLKKLPPPPTGMKWAYDPPKWKVSLVPQ